MSFRPLAASIRVGALVVLVLASLSILGCGANRDTAEERRKLSLRIEHRPPTHSPAHEDVEIRALVQSSLDTPRMEAWVRVIAPPATPDDESGEEADDEAGAQAPAPPPDRRIPLRIGTDGEAVAQIPGRAKGEVVHYVIEARDAAGLVVSLPRGADEGRTYALRFEGSSPRALGGISYLSAILATLFWIGAAAAGVQNLRGRMSAGPAGLLGGTGLLFAIVGLGILGSIHALLVTGTMLPPTSLWMNLGRGDLYFVGLLWIANLTVGRRVLLDESPDGSPSGERLLSAVAIAAGGLTIVLAIR